ncbi:metal-binding protein [Bordetella pertussis]|nr:metal-binding protein [Bordetella pertussis]
MQGYTVEGHVPAADIRRLLRDKPRAVGLTAPGMPIGSPGMDGPAYGGRRDAYDVLLVQPDGSVRVFQAYR